LPIEKQARREEVPFKPYAENIVFLGTSHVGSGVPARSNDQADAGRSA
jgi:hypothetical protein